MNEHELSKLLHEAAEDAALPSTASRRVLRRTRLRMATTGTLMVSVVVLIAGGGFALATKSTETQPRLESTQSLIVTAPDAPESDLVLMEDGGILLAEVQESDDVTWTYSGKGQRSGLCLSSTTHKATTASGKGECFDAGVPQHRHIGFLELDDADRDRYEVLGAVSTDVRRLDFEDDAGDRKSVTIIDAPDELGIGRNFFYLWLPRGEQGALEARSVNEEVLQREQLCLSEIGSGTACTVGEESTASASSPPLLPADLSMACDEISRGKLGRLLGESTPEQTMQRWIDSLDLDLTPDEFEIERMDSGTLAMSLPGPKDSDAVFAILSKKGDHQWSIVELLYCEGIVDPDRHRLPKGLPPPPSEAPTTQPPPPPSPSP